MQQPSRLDTQPIPASVNACHDPSRGTSHDSGASAGRYSFTARDFHSLLPVSLSRRFSLFIFLFCARLMHKTVDCYEKPTESPEDQHKLSCSEEHYHGRNQARPDSVQIANVRPGEWLLSPYRQINLSRGEASPLDVIQTRRP